MPATSITSGLTRQSNTASPHVSLTTAPDNAGAQAVKAALPEPTGQEADSGPASTQLGSVPDTSASTATSDSRLVRYRIEYVGRESGSFSLDGKSSQPNASEEPVVFEFVEVRLTSQNTLSSTAKKEDMPKTDKGKGHPYINILSPAVAEALRCVVDYFPGLDLSGNMIQVYEPYSVFFFFEKELTEYRERAAKLANDNSSTCLNRWADKHIGMVQDFVKKQFQESVDAERERHARGYCTFDMLWLLYKPGCDTYCDPRDVGEHEPYVFSQISFNLVNNATDSYTFSIWNMDADSTWVGPATRDIVVPRFAGEQKISSLKLYPCEHIRFSDDVAEGDMGIIKQHFVDRGKKWYNLRREIKTCQFDGFSTTFPRRTYSSRVIIDPIQYSVWKDVERIELSEGLEQPPGPLKICACKECEEAIYQHAREPKFKGYTKVNPLVVEGLTEHQYFLCDQVVEAFLFTIREWKYLHIDGFREPSFDRTLLDRLVMKSSTKEFIKSLTQMYLRGSAVTSRREEKLYQKISEVHKSSVHKKADTMWSADFIEGKGEGLTILLHGRPGVGKTYTAECIADFTERPLLSLTCSDIGVKPETIEENLLKWFKAAETWGAIILIDEADIYMEQRQVQDIERNHLVAGFLRALEYYKGILFLTTNRVGTFDEAFMSRIHVQIHYPDLEDEERDRLWHTFFEKLEEDREATMRITQSAKDYVEAQELRSLKWNGREIRNAFQVAVALAETQGQKDKEGRVLIKSDHIKATVQMSREFRDYLVKVHKGDLSKRATLMGNRYDAFGKDAGTSASRY